MPLDVDRIEREVRSVSDPNEAFTFLLRILETPIIFQYIEKNPSARNELVAKLPETPSAAAMTPAPTPPDTNLQANASPSPPSRCATTTGDDLLDSLFSEPDDHSHSISPAAAFDGPVFEHDPQTHRFNADSSAHQENSPALHGQGTPKRRQNFEEAGASKRPNIAIGEDLQMLPPECSVISQKEADASTPRSETRGPHSRSKRKKGKAEPPTDFGEDRFAQLPSSLRAKVQHIKGCEDLRNAWLFCSALRRQSSAESSEALARLQQTGHLHVIQPSDPRTKQLRHLIENWDALIFHNSASGIYYHVARRVHLVELAARYLEERDAMEPSETQDTLSDRFVDELFPETIAEPGKKQAPQDKKYREQKKRTLEYWIRLGKRLLEMVKRYDYGVLLIPTRRVADRQLNCLRDRDGQIQHFLDYIDQCHPGLKAKISNLSAILPGAINYGLLPQLLTIETIPYNRLSEIRDFSLEKMFQFSDFAINRPFSGEPYLGEDNALLVNGTVDLPLLSCESQLNQSL